jgi:hypothetical protein
VPGVLIRFLRAHLIAATSIFFLFLAALLLAHHRSPEIRYKRKIRTLVVQFDGSLRLQVGVWF